MKTPTQEALRLPLYWPDLDPSKQRVPKRRDGADFPGPDDNVAKYDLEGTAQSPRAKVDFRVVSHEVDLGVSNEI